MKAVTGVMMMMIKYVHDQTTSIGGQGLDGPGPVSSQKNTASVQNVLDNRSVDSASNIKCLLSVFFFRLQHFMLSRLLATKHVNDGCKHCLINCGDRCSLDERYYKRIVMRLQLLRNTLLVINLQRQVYSMKNNNMNCLFFYFLQHLLTHIECCFHFT